MCTTQSPGSTGIWCALLLLPPIKGLPHGLGAFGRIGLAPEQFCRRVSCKASNCALLATKQNPAAECLAISADHGLSAGRPETIAALRLLLRG